MREADDEDDDGSKIVISDNASIASNLFAPKDYFALLLSFVSLSLQIKWILLRKVHDRLHALAYRGSLSAYFQTLDMENNVLKTKNHAHEE